MKNESVHEQSRRIALGTLSKNTQHTVAHLPWPAATCRLARTRISGHMQGNKAFRCALDVRKVPRKYAIFWHFRPRNQRAVPAFQSCCFHVMLRRSKEKKTAAPACRTPSREQDASGFQAVRIRPHASPEEYFLHFFPRYITNNNKLR